MKYKILTVRERGKLNAEGAIIDIIRVKFRTDMDFLGTLEFDKKGFTHAKAVEAIEAYLREIEALQIEEGAE